MQQGNQALAVGMQKAVVPRPPEALGQDVLQDQAQEVGTGQRAHLRLAALAVAVAKADLAVRARQDVAFPDHPAIEVATEIDQRLLAVADTFAIDYHRFMSNSCRYSHRGLPPHHIAPAYSTANWTVIPQQTGQ